MPYTNAHYVLENVIAKKVVKLVKEKYGEKAASDLDYELTFGSKVHIERNDRYFSDEVSEVVAFFNSDFDDTFDFENAAESLGKLGGQARSKVKARASRANGKLGGRPAKK